jgi:hypothetical protein
VVSSLLIGSGRVMVSKLGGDCRFALPSND